MSRINASLSRQPLVKGERLVRSEVNAAMPRNLPLLGMKVSNAITYRFLSSYLVPIGCAASSESAKLERHGHGDKQACPSDPRGKIL